MKPHKHSEVIKAWADGAEVEFRVQADAVWRDVQGLPVWNEAVEYRIKPAEPEREPYPETQMTGYQLDEYYANSPSVPSYKSDHEESLVWVVNRALRHACDNGQIVTRAEFDRAVGDRAARDMAVAEAMKSAALDWAGRQMASMPKRLENIDTLAVIASVK